MNYFTYLFGIALYLNLITNKNTFRYARQRRYKARPSCH